MFAHGKNAALKVNNGTLRNLSQYITSISGPPGEREMTDSTTMKGTPGVHYRSNTPGLIGWQIQGGGYYDSTVTTGPDAILSALLEDETIRLWEVGYESDATGKVKYSGNGHLSSYVPGGEVAGMVSFTFTVTGSGPVTRGAF